MWFNKTTTPAPAPGSRGPIPSLRPMAPPRQPGIYEVLADMKDAAKVLQVELNTKRQCEDKIKLAEFLLGLAKEKLEKL
jgi:hypothetical protein